MKWTLSPSVISLISLFYLISAPCLGAPPSAAAVTKSKHLSLSEAPTKTLRGAAKRLFIVGFSGSVLLTAVKSTGAGDEVTVRAVKYSDNDEMAMKDENDFVNQLIVKTSNLGDTLEVRAQLPPDRGQWSKWVSGKSAPQVKLEISAPDTLALEIYWAHGDVKVSHWKSPVTVVSEDGKLSIDDIIGDVVAKSMQGSLKIDSIKGSVSVENFNSVVSVTDVTGKVKLRTFSGEAKLKGLAGNSFLSTQKAPLTVQESSGSLEVVTGVGAVRVLDHKGNLVGKTDGGPITAKVLGSVEARFSSVSGPITLSVPRESQAAVNLFSNKGQVTAPKSLEAKSGSTGHGAVRGTLGGSQPGSVRVNSESGDVILKVL